MNPDDAGHDAAEEEFAAKLASFDEALKAGALPVQSGSLPEDSPTAVETTFARAQECLRLLEQAWPRRHDAAPRRPAPYEPLPTGSAVGPYRIMGRRGGGGMGVIYQAYDTQLGRTVALKFLRWERAADPDLVERFQREARAASALNHPHLCAVHAVGTHANQPYLVMEWIDGGTLAHHLGGAPLSSRDAAALLLPLAHAVAYAHGRGIIHRDLKPANVLLTNGGAALGVPKIVDFGLAKRLDVESHTQTGELLGTPNYMAPEQTSGRPQEIGPAADIYALGAILYELLTGRPPFVGSTPLETLNQVRDHEPVPPCRLQPQVPHDLEVICLKCLRKAPSERYASAAALAEDLQHFQAGKPIAARPVSALERTTKWVRRHKTITGLLALVVLLAAGGAALVAWHWRSAVLALEEAEAARRERALAQVNALRVAAPAAVPGILEDLEQSRADVLPRLHELWAEGDAELPRMRVGLALLPVAPTLVRDELEAWLLQADDPAEVLLAREALRSHRTDLIPRLWERAEDVQRPEAERLRALAALALYDPDDERWLTMSTTAVRLLFAANPFYQRQWADALRPVRGVLLRPLGEGFRDVHKPEQRYTAANVLANYCAETPDRLCDLLLEADVRQFAVLRRALEHHRTQLLERMRHELTTPGVDWQDAPLAPVWTALPADLQQEIEQADGLVAERFALCQSLPLERLLPLAEALRPTGYRPLRVQPWQDGAAARVAILWTRDGCPWRLDLDRTAQQVQEDQAARRLAGLAAADVGGLGMHYTVLWVHASDGDQVEVLVGLTRTELAAQTAALRQKGYRPVTAHAMPDPQGHLRFAGIWSNRPAARGGLDANLYEAEYEEALADFTFLPTEVHVHAAGPLLSEAEFWQGALEFAQQKLDANQDVGNMLHNRAQARIGLGRDTEALPDLALLQLNHPTYAEPYALRAGVYARQGRVAAARADLAMFRQYSPDAVRQCVVEAQVGAWLGDEVDALKRLEALVRREPHQHRILSEAGRIYSSCAAIVARRQAAQAAAALALDATSPLQAAVLLTELAAQRQRPGQYAERGLELMRQAVAAGERGFEWIKNRVELAPLRALPGFAELIRRGHLERQYSVIRRPLPDLEAAESHGLGLPEHLGRCRELMAQGYRPVALSACAAQDTVSTASVWHRPRQTISQRAQQARRQAQAAATLLTLGDAAPVWPLWQHGEQPEARSQLVWRTRLFGADPRLLVRRLAEETDVSARRALIVALGDYPAAQLPEAVRAPLTRQLLAWYRDDPDPGIHGAIDWLLRHAREGPDARPLDWGQAQELTQIDRALTRREPDGARRWYVNGQGQTMVLIPGPVEFRMGSPPDEPGRSDSERLHRRRIERSFAIASKAVTVEQFQRFVQERAEPGWFPTGYVPEPECPINVVSWTAAARYCNWLSEKEGIPRQEWCYPEPEALRDGMKLFPDYLRRTGYRLPTEAEWEYSCRAGAASSYSYGSSAELLPRYAWFTHNAQDRAWPVGQKRPSDLGLFDMHGGMHTWVQNRLQPYGALAVIVDEEDTQPLDFTKQHVGRGGSFGHLPWSARAAARNTARLDDRMYFLGLRVVRTYRASP
jgi:formylglycine-generating enzyme required for sulfatase activity